MSTPKLFQPIQVGELPLEHRVVMAPLTRFRADDKHVPSPLAEEYYYQRASAPGTLLISEATFIAPRAGGFTNVPGIYTPEHIAAWQKITNAVHAKGSFIFCQLWALGRAAVPAQLAQDDPALPYVSASDVKLSARLDEPAPRPLTVPEIEEYVRLYAAAAENAIAAGFDGVEVHGAHGYLVDQFIADASNKRTDEYGGSAANRSRFALEVVDAVVKAVGEKRAAIRFSPWAHIQDSRDSDVIGTFTYLITELRKRHQNLAYIHVVEPRVNGHDTIEIPEGESNDFIRAIWKDGVVISAGGHTRETGLEVAETKGGLVAYGRPFIANPDLVYRLRKNIPLTQGDRETYYNYGSLDPNGYTTYPFATDKDLSS